MNFSNIFFAALIISISFDFILNQALEFSNFSFRKKNGTTIPQVLQEYLDTATVEKSIAYKNSRYKLWVINNILLTAVNLTLILSGFYSFIIKFTLSLTTKTFPVLLLFSILSGIITEIIELPFSLYREFVIEKKFGFSNMTLKMWIADELKGLAMNAVLMLPLLGIICLILIHLNSWWWLLVSAVMVIFSLGISYIYPTVLAPIFNKFIPLENKELAERLENLLNKTGFKANGIFQMDASKRSGHSNAYFTGLGKNKRIVLFDTLLEQLTPEEIEAVLGHELGHCKKHHITKKLCFSIPMIFIVSFITSLFAKMPLLHQAFGITQDLYNGANCPQAIITFTGIQFLSMAFGGFGSLVSLVTNTFSRKDEYQADAFSVQICNSAKNLSTALIKLNKENLSDIQVPKIYSMFNYSHPQLLERLDAMNKLNKN